MSADKGNITVNSEPVTPPSCKAHGLAVFCSVCLEIVADGGERSIAKLKCGHYFHLDCIGSAFNAKGRMQCPNCRQVEQGQWLYANSYILHDDFVDDITFEEDGEAFGASATVHFGHMPWCPHQGPYTQLPVSLDDLESFENIYVEPVAQEARVSALTGHTCPFLQVEDLLAMHISPRSNRTVRRPADFLTQGSSSQRHALSAASSSVSALREGTPQSYTSGGTFLQPSAIQRSPPGVFVATHHQDRVNRGENLASHVGRSYAHLPRAFSNTHGPYGLQSLNNIRNQHVGSRQVRHGESLSSSFSRTPHASPLAEGAWISDQDSSWVAVGNSSQNSSQVTGENSVGWTPVGQFDPWSAGFYAPGSYVNSSHWWTWVPPGTNQGQSTLPSMAPTSLLSRLSTSTAGHTERMEGPFAWDYHGPQ